MMRAEFTGLQSPLKYITDLKHIINNYNYDIVIAVESKIGLTWLKNYKKISMKSVNNKIHALREPCKKYNVGYIPLKENPANFLTKKRSLGNKKRSRLLALRCTNK
jgi:hypothetical protein